MQTFCKQVQVKLLVFSLCNCLPMAASKGLVSSLRLPITSPNLDQLAANAVLFENAVATSSLTLPFHASSGPLDSTHQVKEEND